MWLLIEIALVADWGGAPEKTYSKRDLSIASIDPVLRFLIARPGMLLRNRALGRELSCLSQTSAMRSYLFSAT